MDHHADVNARVSRRIEHLRTLNLATLFIALVVYAGLLAIAAAQRVVPLAVFASCIMVAEILVFQFVRTWCDHVEALGRYLADGGQR